MWIRESKDRTMEMAQPDHSSDEEKVQKERRSCKVTCQQSKDEQPQVQ